MEYHELTAAKEKLDKHRPLPREMVRNLDDWFRVELTYTSNAIEGNTLSRNETALVLEKGITVGGKSLVEHLEASNHGHAVDWIRKMAQRTPDQLNENDIPALHGIVLKGIDDRNAGRYRTVPVRIMGSVVALPNPRKVPALMNNFCRWLQGADVLHPVALAAEAHYRLVTIHPFVDGNGRTARLLMNLVLLMEGYPPAIIREHDRLAYINALERAQADGNKDDYLQLIMEAVDRSLAIYLDAIYQLPDEKTLPS